MHLCRTIKQPSCQEITDHSLKGQRPRPHEPDSGKLLTHNHHIFSKADTACTPNKSSMVAYQGGVHTVGVGIVIILLCVAHITSNIHLNNAI